MMFNTCLTCKKVYRTFPSKKSKYCSKSCHPAWNKGIPNSGFKKGHISWLKGRKGYTNSGSFVKGHGFWTGKKRPGLVTSSQFKKGQTSGEKNYKWRGGITPEIRKIRNSTEYKEWRLAVFKKDRWTCVFCSSKERIQADHIRPFSLFPELRFEISNGRTLCHECHKILTTSTNKRPKTREEYLCLG